MFGLMVWNGGLRLLGRRLGVGSLHSMFRGLTLGGVLSRDNSGLLTPLTGMRSRGLTRPEEEDVRSRCAACGRSRNRQDCARTRRKPGAGYQGALLPHCG